MFNLNDEMTKDRAKYILDNQLPFGELKYSFRKYNQSHTLYADGITYSEDKIIKALWEKMPGDTCYYQALLRIAKGENSL